MVSTSNYAWSTQTAKINPLGMAGRVLARSSSSCPQITRDIAARLPSSFGAMMTGGA